MGYDLEKYEKLAQKMLSAKRFHHTQCVVERARQLAALYGCDVEKAAAAAWLHDICKEQKQEEQLHWLTKFGIMLDDVQKTQPKTWHGMAACGYMREELGIIDPEILQAVRYHTTGSGCMSALDEVVYLADLTSAERDYPGAQEMRALAEKGLKNAMREAMIFALSDLVQRGLGISRDSFEAYNRYITPAAGEAAVK